MFGIRIVKRVRTIAAALSELETLAARYEVSIVSGKEFALIFSPEDIPFQVTYPGNAKSRTKLWGIAHELGHLIVLHNFRSKLTKKFRAAAAGSFWQLEDEILAWGIADQILDQLSPSFYEENYIKWKHSQLKTYYRY